MIDKTINDIPLKKLTFQTGQTKWDGGSNNKARLVHGLKTENCYLKTFLEIRVVEKVRENTWNVI